MSLINGFWALGPLFFFFLKKMGLGFRMLLDHFVAWPNNSACHCCAQQKHNFSCTHPSWWGGWHGKGQGEESTGRGSGQGGEVSATAQSAAAHYSAASCSSVCAAHSDGRGMGKVQGAWGRGVWEEVEQAVGPCPTAALNYEQQQHHEQCSKCCAVVHSNSNKIGRARYLGSKREARKHSKE
jgi:hypothetical protein